MHTWLHNLTHTETQHVHYVTFCAICTMCWEEGKRPCREDTSPALIALWSATVALIVRGRGVICKGSYREGGGRKANVEHHVIRHRFMCSLTCHRKSSRDSTASIYMSPTAKRDVHKLECDRACIQLLSGCISNRVRIPHKCRHFSSHKHSNTKQSCKTFRLQNGFLYGYINFKKAWVFPQDTFYSTQKTKHV